MGLIPLGGTDRGEVSKIDPRSLNIWSGSILAAVGWTSWQHIKSKSHENVEGLRMIWMRMLAYITGTVDQELLMRNEYLVAENRILRAKVQGRLLLSHWEKATLAESPNVWDVRLWPT